MFSLSSPATLLQATPPPLPPRLSPSTPSSQPVPHQACRALYRTSLQRPLFPPYHICLSSFLSSFLASCDCLRLVTLVRIHWCAPPLRILRLRPLTPYVPSAPVTHISGSVPVWLYVVCIYIGGNGVFHCIAPFFPVFPGSTHWPRLLIPPPRHRLAPPSPDSNGELRGKNYWLFQCPNHSPPPLPPTAPMLSPSAVYPSPLIYRPLHSEHVTFLIASSNLQQWHVLKLKGIGSRYKGLIEIIDLYWPCGRHVRLCNSVFHCIAPFFPGLPGSTHWPRLLTPPQAQTCSPLSRQQR